jgi:hypothetical protein
MSRCLGAILICAVILSAYGQTTSSKFQPGTITEVVAHQNAPGETSDVARYDVSVKVGNTVYKVLYTPPNGANRVKYSAGIELLVSVGADTLTFNSQLSGTTVVPILSRQTLPAQNDVDLSKVPSQYFTMKLERLSETLNLREDQQAKIKPILEQETGEVGQIFNNPVISNQDKLSRWEKIVQSSDAKIKPFLSDEQLQKLRDMRKQQIQDLKKLISEPKAGNQS